jgi:hypothetical protein
VSGLVTPKYYVLTVVYAPPGTNGGHSTSSVSYGSGSTTGTTVSSSDSFKQGLSVTVTAEGGFLGSGGQAEGNFGVTTNASNSQTLNISKSVTSEIADPGPSVDGIDHDHDLIYLWLNPSIQLKLFPTVSGAVSKAVWEPVNTQQAEITYLYVGWLKHPSQIPPGELQLLQRFGITTADFPQILKADPYAFPSGHSTEVPDKEPDPRRFKPLFETFPYEPPFAKTDPVPTTKLTLAYTNKQDSSASDQAENTVGLKLQASGGFPGLAKLTLKDQLNWTWTSVNTASSSSAATESATAVIGGPAFGYQGPTDVGVYYDTIYKTFLFVMLPVVGQPTIEGLVTNSSGQPMARKQVVISSNGIQYRTLTNAKGEYRIFNRISGPIRIQVEGSTKDLSQVPGNRKADITLSR